MSASGGDVEVAVRAAGAAEAEQDLARVENRLESAGDTMGDTTDNMAGLNRKMSGLGKSIVAGLAVVAGGLLSQVPVIGEVMGGLSAVMNSVAYQVDRVLRPSLSNLTDDLFELAAAIGEGDSEGVLKALGDLQDSMEDLEARKIELTVDVIFALPDIAGLLADNIQNVDLGDVIMDALERAPVAGHLIWMIRLANEMTNRFFEHFGIDMTVKELFEKSIENVKEGAKLLYAEMKKAADDPVEYFTDVFESLVDGAMDWGEGLVDELITGIGNMIPDLREAVSDTVDAIKDELPDEIAEGIDWTAGVAEDTYNWATGNDGGGGGSGGGGGGGGGGGSAFAANRTYRNIPINMDGRMLTRQDGRYRRDGTARRNRNG